MKFLLVFFNFANLHFRVNFMANPLIWMQVLAQYKINISLTPNFAYGAVTRAMKSLPMEKRPAQAIGGGPNGTAWDLTSVCHLNSAGEPIQPAVVKEFFTLFQQAGLKYESFRVSCVDRSHAIWY